MNQERYNELLSRLEHHYGLPSGYLARTAQIESGFNAQSHNQFSGADGIFQFIPSTARLYGLKYGRGPGSTGDPVASAHAAARLSVSRQMTPTASLSALAHLATKSISFVIARNTGKRQSLTSALALAAKKL